jgi:hypothetical protein
MDQLTEREQEVAALFADDQQNPQISGKMELQWWMSIVRPRRSANG